MVSLKSLVSAILLLLFFALPISGPKTLGAPYVVMLAFLRPAAEQDQQALAIAAKVDSITGAEVDAVFLNPASNALRIGEVPLCHSSNSERHFRRRLRSG